jgi:hypothetical protein
MANKNLNAAKTAKKDEFYTQMTDIERELQHHWKHFAGKVVLCNCDDPYESNFFKYFALRFNQLGLKKLICTCYNGSPVQGNELMIDFGDFEEEPKKVAYKVEITEVKDLNGDGAVDLSDVQYLLQNDKNVIGTLKTGDFRDPECIELLEQSDVVVTNPPFSLFREYIGQLMEYDKKFLIIGPLNALHYKEVFPLLKDNDIWLGYNNGAKEYNKPDGTKQKMGNTGWFTNLDHNKRHEELDLVCRFSPGDYPTYENYNAIDVGRVQDIPYDFDGIMGVPDTILGQYNPDQFEIIGLGSGTLGQSIGVGGIPKEHKRLMKGHSAAGDLYILIKGIPKVPYSRILIRNKHPQKL